jgi:hypothetical protein
MRKLYLTIFLFIPCAAFAGNPNWVIPRGALTFDGFIVSSERTAATFYGYSNIPVKINFKLQEGSFGVSVQKEGDADKFSRLSKSYAKEMSTILDNLKDKKSVVVFQSAFFNNYHVLVTAKKIDPYHISSRLFLIKGNQKFSQQYDYGLLNDVSPVSIGARNYLVLSVISCSASNCNTEISAYELD